LPDSSPTRAANGQRTLRLLLIPQPLLALAYLAGIRTDVVAPSFVPVILFAAFPLVAVIAAVVSLRNRNAARRSNWSVLALGVMELVFAVMTCAIVGFAIGLRSG
jgi:hypothetical protein